MNGKPWRIELLGDVRARYGDGAWLPLPSHKPVALLLYLAASPQRPHPREALIDFLWPEADPEAGRLSLRTVLHALRRLLESTGAEASTLLLAERTTLRLDPAAFTTDLAEYLTAVSHAERARTPHERSQALGHAAACYTGEFLPGFTDGWAFVQRERLLTTQRELLQRLVRVREELGEGEGALSAAREMVRLEPLWEEGHYEVMRLYAALGQPSACLRQYQELERVLREELNEVPSAQVRALAEELRHGARSIVVARSAVAPTDVGSEGASGSGGEGATAAAGNLHADRPANDSSCPLAPSPSPRLPVQMTRFFGREEEIAWLTQTLCYPDVRLVTLTGPGGTGKTRLAVTAAGRLLEAWEGAVSFVPLADLVPLAEVADGVRDRIATAIASAMGLLPSAEESPLGQVVEALRRRSTLLVLDNFEQLVELGAPLVSTLLERVPSLTCLVTSRRHLDLVGEQEFAVLPLPAPTTSAALGAGLWALGSRQTAEAPRNLRIPAVPPHPAPSAQRPERLIDFPSVALFVDRARAVRPGFQIDAKNAGAVAALCDRLEGLPLALELAATWVRTLSPAQILERLSQRFELLVGRQRNVEARHRSLRAAIEWSYQLLSPEQRRFFTRLSVFRGGWTLEAAEAVTEEPPALEYLQQLQQCSLVVGEEAGEAMRYRLLETLREYGWEQLVASGELSAVRNRHREWYLRLAERAYAAADGPEPTVWLMRLEAELDNLRAVLAWCQESADAEPESECAGAAPAAEVGLRLASALWWFWFRRGSLAEGLQWLEGALARGGDLLASLRAPALLHSAYLVHARGERERAQSLLRASRHEYEKTLALAHASGDRRAIADASLALTEAAVRTVDEEGARRYAAEARQQMEALGDRGGLIHTISLMASLALSRGDRQTARPLMEELISLCRELGESEHLIHALGAMGHLARDEGDTASARSWYAESLALRRKMGNQFALAQSLEDFAVLAGREQQAERAIRLLGAGEAFCETLGARLPVTDVQDYERTVAEGRAALGDAAFAAVWAEGRTLSLQAAVDYALSGSR